MQKRFFSHLLLLSVLMAQPLIIQPNTQSISTQNPGYAVVADLEPHSVWRYFAEISQIPRSSYHEDMVARKAMDEAAKYNCSAIRDSVGNVIVRKPASSPDYQDAPIVVIQCHLDMVCEKNKNIEHDFTKDPIRFVRKGNHLYADGTTLGADNGIGVAAALAIISSNNLVHGPLEFLFTVVEEAGFDGAKNVTADTINGRILLNIDTEDKALYIGCAGSACVIATLPLKRVNTNDACSYYAISIDGLRGGHSGVDIDQGRVNALQVAGKILQDLHNAKIDFKLISVDGGNKRNAIARDAEIVLAVRPGDVDAFESAISLIEQGCIACHKSNEANLMIAHRLALSSKPGMDADSQARVIELMQAMPHGVVAMSALIPNLVETSTNFARVATADGAITFETMQRSLVGEETKAIVTKVQNVCASYGCTVCVTDGSPEWQPNEQSQVLHMAQATSKRVFGEELPIKAIHAGLECGAFVRQVPGLDAISFGPTIYDAHSPSEHVDVTTVAPFWLFLTELIGDIARQHAQSK